jgi:small subunit ribosomal protein S21
VIFTLCEFQGRSSTRATGVDLIPKREDFVVKLRLREHESINDAVKRFRKLVEHAGIKKEMRRREYYEKPSDQRRRARRRAERRARLLRLPAGT